MSQFAVPKELATSRQYPWGASRILVSVVLTLCLVLPSFVYGEENRLKAESFCVITPENANQVELVATLTGHSDGVWNAVFSPDGSLLASGAQDRLVHLRNLNDVSTVTVLSGHFTWVLGLAFSPDGQILASAGTDGFNGTVQGLIRLWDVASSSQVNLLLGHASGTWSLDFQESTGHLVSGGKDGLVKIWDITAADPLLTLSGHSGWVLSVDFNPVQDLVASSATDHTVRLWNSQTGESVNVLTGHTNNVGFVKFNPSGDLLASSADDETVRLWNVSDGAQIWSRAAGQGWVNGVNFNPAGDVILSCGHDGSVVLRRTDNGDQLIRLTGHTHPVLRGSFNPEGTMFATASWDNTVRIWAIRPTVGATEHTPSIPAAEDSVGVKTEVSNCGEVVTASLHYDAGDGFQIVPMLDDGAHGDGSAGDMIYGAFISALPSGTNVKYYVSISDLFDGLSVDPAGAPVSCYEYTVGCCGRYTGGRTGNTNCDVDGKRNLADISRLIDYVYITKAPLCCDGNGNVNGDIDNKINLADVSKLIDHVYISKAETANCG